MVINEQVLANELEVGLFTRGLSQVEAELQVLGNWSQPLLAGSLGLPFSSQSLCLSLRATAHPLLAHFTISTPSVLCLGTESDMSVAQGPLRTLFPGNRRPP